MATKQLMAYCKKCEKSVLHIQQKPNHVLHLLLVPFTFGLWSIVWAALIFMPTRKRCTACGK